MKQVYRACKKCKLITTEKNCPIHGDERTTTEWFGFTIITEPTVSNIAKKAGITEHGAYAIKVRQ
ncbi:MAG TPA: transcription elongation factor subunit Spt4 [Thermoplasmataceae archaeon]|nr:DNA-directed RNA polymerase subunit E'' [Thermoplasmatales archaeon AK]HLH85740.1 transcription elongation factor subunit Spt4 [Thermoplasmataceae archaeon]